MSANRVASWAASRCNPLARWPERLERGSGMRTALRVCLDQVHFMSELFDLDALSTRIRRYVDRLESLKQEAAPMLEAVLQRGELERGDVMRVSGLPERPAQRILGDLLTLGLLASETPKGGVSLRFPVHALEDLFLPLFPQS